MNKQDKNYYKEYYEKNKEKISDKKKEYYKKNKDKISEQQKKYYSENTDKVLARESEKYYNDLEKTRNKKLKYYYKNRDKILEKQRLNYIKNSGSEKTKKRRQIDILFRLKTYLGNRIKDYMKQISCKKNSRTFEIIGCEPKELKLYLESKFKDGMTWENHGDWHIDHIIPLSSAKTEEEIYKLNHYTNLQPLWKQEKLSKGNKIIIN